NRGGPGADLNDDAVSIVTHLHPAVVARQPLGRFRGNVVGLDRGRLGPLDITRHSQCPDLYGASFGLQPPADDDHTVLILIHVKRPTTVAQLGLVRLGLPIDSAPTRTMRSTCSAVPARPTASSRSSVAGVATWVSARTLA